MTHYVIELALWILGLYVVGCLAGGLLRHWFGPPAAAEAADQDAPKP
jgi:hypothetical protein